MSSLNGTFHNFCCFSESEKRIVEVVHSVTSKLIAANHPQYRDLFKEAEVSRKMQQIVRYFEETDHARSEFMGSYGCWSKFRKSTIQDLKDISTALHENRRCTNGAKLVAAGVGAAGGAMALCPLLLPLGIFVGLTAGMTTFIISMDELKVMKQQTEKTKKSLEEDRKHFECLQKWFGRSSQLIDAIDELMGFSVMDMLKNEFREIWRQFQRVKYSIDSLTLAQLTLLFTPIAIALVPKLLPQFGALMVIQLVVFVCVVVFMRDHNRYILDAMLGAQKLASFGALVFSKSFRWVVGAGIALDVVSFITTLDDMNKGSVCELGVKVESVANQLKEEFDFIEKVYNHFANGRSIEY